MGPKLQPALLGGLLIGVLSALPFVSMCCCLWVIAGGVLTTYLLQERMTTPVTAGDATIAGLLAGIVGAILVGQGRLPPEMTGALEQVRDMPPAIFIIGSLLVSLFIYPIFSMLGALLGVALFKRQPPPPPPGTVEILPPE
jgi:hypothetical protein